MITNADIRRYMQSRLDDHRQPCGEVNHTALAEDAAAEFDIYEDRRDYAIPEWVYELALAVDPEAQQ